MRNSIFIVLGFLAVVCLTGCNKIPSCGDTLATDTVSRILKDAVLKDTNDLADDMKTHLNVSVEQAVLKSKNENTSALSCKAVANFHLEPATMASLKQIGNDKVLAEAVGKKYRELVGLESMPDILAVLEKIQAGEANHDPKLADYKNQVRVMLRLDSNASDDALNAQIFQIGAQRPAELQKNSELLQQAITSIDEKSGSINLNLEYSIEKIENAKDGKPFMFNVSAQQDTIDGIRMLEVWNLAGIYLEKESKETKSTAAAVAAKPVTPAPTPVSDRTLTSFAGWISSFRIVVLPPSHAARWQWICG